MDLSTLQLNKEIIDKYSVKDNTFIQVVKSNPKDRIDVEVGDSKQLDFYPQVKVQRWDNECNVSIRLKDDGLEKETVSTDKNKIIWSKDKREVNFYDIKNEEHPDGAYEFEVILKEKPSTNVVEFTLQDKNVDYFYQPEIIIPKNEIKHEDIISYIQKKNPVSLVDLGGGTGELAKIFNGTCIDNSNEAYALRVTERYIKTNILDGLSMIKDNQFDLCTGIGFLKYIPEDKIELVIKEIARISSRGYFTLKAGFVGFSDMPPIVNEEGVDWWITKFNEFAPNYEVEINTIYSGNIRPENVVGSYAIYHKTKGVINKSNDKDYSTGKVGHIYRPKIIDSVGTEVWGDLHIENGILSVTIPQEFLDKAVYPVRHAAGLTFGFTTAGASSFAHISIGFYSTVTYYGRVGTAFTLSESGTLDSTKAWLKSDGGSYSVDHKFFVNTKDSGGSGVHGQVAVKENTAISLTGTFTAQTFTNSSESLSATDYVLNILGDGADMPDTDYGTAKIYVAYDTGGSGEDYETTTGGKSTGYSSLATDPYTASDLSRGYKFSLSATYTAGGGGSTPTPSRLAALCAG